MTEKKPLLSPPSFYLLAGLALLLPFGLLILRLNLSAWPDADYWFMFLQIWEEDGSLDIAGLFQPWNKHFMVPGKLIYVLNTYLAGGTNYGLVTCAISLSFFCALMVSLIWLRSVDSRHDLVKIIGVFAIATAMTPVSASHLFQLGMSGTVWWSANLMALLALAALVRAWHQPERASVPWISLAGGLGVLGCLSYGTGYAIIPALILTSILAKRPWKELLWLTPWLLVSLALFLMVLEGDVPSPQSPERPGYVKLALILASLVGGLFTPDSLTALLIGIPICIGFAVLAYRLYREQPGVSALSWYFFGVTLFGGGAMALITLGRFGHPIFYIMNQSRYHSLPSLFLLGMVICGILLLLKNRDQLPGKNTALLLLCIALPVAFTAGVLSRQPIDWNKMTISKNRSATVLRLGVIPASRAIFPKQEQDFKHLVSALQALGHYPYNSAHPLHDRLGQSITKPQGMLPLHNYAINPLSEAALEVHGIFKEPPGERLEYVFLTDQSGEIIGGAVPGFEVMISGAPPQIRGFSGLARPTQDSRRELHFYGVLKGREGFYRLVPPEEQRPAPDPAEKPDSAADPS